MNERIWDAPAHAFIVIPVVQFLACLIFPQVALGTVFCLASQVPGVSYAGTCVWLLLAASLPLGFAATGLRQLRLAYLVLLALIPVSLLVQQALLSRGILTCEFI